MRALKQVRRFVRGARLKVIGRYLVVAGVVMMLSVPVEGRTKDAESVWTGPNREQIVKIMKKLKDLIRTFGDGLSDPKP